MDLLTTVCVLYLFSICSENLFTSLHFDLINKVPVGTVFKDAESYRLLMDLKRNEDIFVAARGGAGGKGNHFFLSNELRAPTIAEKGAEGESLHYLVEMKIMAHLGLVCVTVFIF